MDRISDRSSMPRLAIAVVMAPFRLHIAEAGHLALLEGGHHVAPAQVAVDPVAGYPVAQDGLGLLAQLPQQARVVLADPAGHGAHRRVVGGDDLAAVAARRSPADLLRFQHDDVIAPLRQIAERSKARYSRRPPRRRRTGPRRRVPDDRAGAGRCRCTRNGDAACRPLNGWPPPPETGLRQPRTGQRLSHQGVHLRQRSSVCAGPNMAA